MILTVYVSGLAISFLINIILLAKSLSEGHEDSDLEHVLIYAGMTFTDLMGTAFVLSMFWFISLPVFFVYFFVHWFYNRFLMKRGN